MRVQTYRPIASVGPAERGFRKALTRFCPSLRPSPHGVKNAAGGGGACRLIPGR
jgi:hypothetical protein